MAAEYADLIVRGRNDPASLKKASEQWDNVVSKQRTLKVNAPKLALGKITGDFHQFEESLKSASARVLAFTATTTAFYGVGRAIKSLIGDSIKLETSLTKIQSISKATSREISSFGNSLFKTANELGVSIFELADGAEEFSRQGLSLADSLKAVAAAQSLVKLSGGDLKSAIQGLVGVLTTYSKESLEYIQVVDKLASVDAKFATSAAGIVEGLKRVGGVASEAGLSLDKTIAIIASLKQVSGRSESVLANGLKSITVNLQSDKVQTFLEGISVKTREADGSFRELYSVLQDIARIYPKLSDAQQAATRQTVAGKYQSNVFQSLVSSFQGGDTSLVEKARGISENATNESQRRVRLLADTTEAELTRLQNDFSKFGVAMGEGIGKPILVSITKTFRDILETATNIFGNDTFVNIFKNVLTGPGLAVAAVSLTKLFVAISKNAIAAVKSLSSVNGMKEKSLAVEGQITQAIQSGDQALVAKIASTTSLIEKQKLLNQLLAEANALQNTTKYNQKALGLPAGVAASSLQNAGIANKIGAKFRGGRFADGLIPSGLKQAINREKMDIGRGAGGASPSAKPYLTILNGDKGKELAVVNTDEKVVSNYKGSGKSAVITKSMMRQGVKSYAEGGKFSVFSLSDPKQIAKLNKLSQKLKGLGDKTFEFPSSNPSSLLSKLPTSELKKAQKAFSEKFIKNSVAALIPQLKHLEAQVASGVIPKSQKITTNPAKDFSIALARAKTSQQRQDYKSQYKILPSDSSAFNPTTALGPGNKQGVKDLAAAQTEEKKKRKEIARNRGALLRSTAIQSSTSSSTKSAPIGPSFPGPITNTVYAANKNVSKNLERGGRFVTAPPGRVLAGTGRKSFFMGSGSPDLYNVAGKEQRTSSPGLAGNLGGAATNLLQKQVQAEQRAKEVAAANEKIKKANIRDSLRHSIPKEYKDARNATFARNKEDVIKRSNYASKISQGMAEKERKDNATRVVSPGYSNNNLVLANNRKDIAQAIRKQRRDARVDLILANNNPSAAANARHSGKAQERLNSVARLGEFATPKGFGRFSNEGFGTHYRTATPILPHNPNQATQGRALASLYIGSGSPQTLGANFAGDRSKTVFSNPQINQSVASGVSTGNTPLIINNGRNAEMAEKRLQSVKESNTRALGDERKSAREAFKQSITDKFTKSKDRGYVAQRFGFAEKAYNGNIGSKGIKNLISKGEGLGLGKEQTKALIDNARLQKRSLQQEQKVARSNKFSGTSSKLLIGSIIASAAQGDGTGVRGAVGAGLSTGLSVAAFSGGNPVGLAAAAVVGVVTAFSTYTKKANTSLQDLTKSAEELVSANQKLANSASTYVDITEQLSEAVSSGDLPKIAELSKKQTDQAASLRTSDKSGNVTTKLLTAKTREERTAALSDLQDTQRQEEALSRFKLGKAQLFETKKSINYNEVDQDGNSTQIAKSAQLQKDITNEFVSMIDFSKLSPATLKRAAGNNFYGFDDKDVASGGVSADAKNIYKKAYNSESSGDFEKAIRSAARSAIIQKTIQRSNEVDAQGNKVFKDTSKGRLFLQDYASIKNNSQFNLEDARANTGLNANKENLSEKRFLEYKNQLDTRQISRDANSQRQSLAASVFKDVGAIDSIPNLDKALSEFASSKDLEQLQKALGNTGDNKELEKIFNEAYLKLEEISENEKTGLQIAKENLAAAIKVAQVQERTQILGGANILEPINAELNNITKGITTYFSKLGDTTAQRDINNLKGVDDKKAGELFKEDLYGKRDRARSVIQGYESRRNLGLSAAYGNLNFSDPVTKERIQSRDKGNLETEYKNILKANLIESGTSQLNASFSGLRQGTTNAAKSRGLAFDNPLTQEQERDIRNKFAAGDIAGAENVVQSTLNSGKNIAPEIQEELSRLVDFFTEQGVLSENIGAAASERATVFTKFGDTQNSKDILGTFTSDTEKQLGLLGSINSTLKRIQDELSTNEALIKDTAGNEDFVNYLKGQRLQTTENLGKATTSREFTTNTEKQAEIDNKLEQLYRGGAQAQTVKDQILSEEKTQFDKYKTNKTTPGSSLLPPPQLSGPLNPEFQKELEARRQTEMETARTRLSQNRRGMDELYVQRDAVENSFQGSPSTKEAEIRKIDQKIKDKRGEIQSDTSLIRQGGQNTVPNVKIDKESLAGLKVAVENSVTEQVNATFDVALTLTGGQDIVNSEEFKTRFTALFSELYRANNNGKNPIIPQEESAAV